jgi:type IV pilus assembly protein PilB
MRVEPQKLEKYILDAGLIDEKKFDKAKKIFEKSNQELGDVLVSEGLLEEKELIKIEAYLLGIPFINLEDEVIPTDVLKIIPEPIARVNNIVAFRKKDNDLEVAMLDPEDLRIIEFIKKTDPSLRILSRLTTSDGIKNALSQYQKNLETEFRDIIDEEAKSIRHIKNQDAPEGEVNERLEKVAQELPIIKVVDTLMKHAILQRASDVHIEPLEEEVIVRYRIDGILHVVMNLPASVSSGIVARIKVLSNLKLDEHRLPQDGRFKIETADYKYSVRVSILPVYNGEKIVMRLLAEDVKVLTLEGSGLSGSSLQNAKDSLLHDSGMILIAGPTGSGKTTTLYTMMQILNTPDVNISTIEDPIEYRMPKINQTQVDSKIGLTFALGLRVLVRQDPDIIMVGEIRDDETASLAVNAALTGHLVLSTIHTTEAAGAIPRLIDMQVEPFLISSTLNLIIAQRLVRKFCEKKEAYKLSADELDNLAKYCDLDRILKILKEEKLAKAGDTMKDVNFYRPKSSRESLDGYKGRLGIFEVLPVTEVIKDMIVKKATTSMIAEQAKKDGMRTMIEDGFVKAVQGLTSIEEILRVITE